MANVLNGGGCVEMMITALPVQHPTVLFCEESLC